MLLFSYEARNRTGDRFEGSVEAASRREAAQKIRQRGLWVAALRLQGEKGKETGLLARVRERPHWLRLSARSLDGRRACVLFLRQLSLLTAAGLPLHEALGVLAGPGEVAPSTAPGKGIQSGNHSAYAEMAGCLRAQVLRGEPLSAALAERPDVFPASVCQLVRMGEESGSLDSILPELADHMELAMRTRAKLRAAMAYPLLLFVTALVAGVLMTLFILPAFAALLASLSAELPWPTRMLLACSGFLQSHGLILLLGTGAILLGSSWFFSRPGRAASSIPSCCACPSLASCSRMANGRRFFLCWASCCSMACHWIARWLWAQRCRAIASCATGCGRHSCACRAAPR